MRKLNIGLIGILLFILVIVSIDLNFANAQALRAVLSTKTVGLTTASCREGAVVLRKQTSMAEELSGASLGLQEA